jgi:hypothetical protein
VTSGLWAAGVAWVAVAAVSCGVVGWDLGRRAERRRHRATVSTATLRGIAVSWRADAERLPFYEEEKRWAIQAAATQLEELAAAVEGVSP